MMWRTRTAVVGLMGLACTGRYEVGAMELATSGTGGASVMAGTPTGGTMMVMVPKSLGGSSGDSELGPTCVPGEMPEPLEGELAGPDLVWSRLSPVIWGDEVTEP